MAMPARPTSTMRAGRIRCASRVCAAAPNEKPANRNGAAPGSASQRNAERQGFRIAYTRIKWMLEA